MRNKPRSLQSSWTTHLLETEQRLEDFLHTQEKLIEEVISRVMKWQPRESVTWQVKRAMFDICLRTALRRSGEISAYLAAAEKTEKDTASFGGRTARGSNIVLQCLPASDDSSWRRQA